MNSDLAVARYRVTLVAEQPARLPAFPGPTLRGGLGHVLRRLVCVTRLPACDACMLRHTCAYPVLYQPYAPPDHPAQARYARMPPPFVLRVPLDATPRLRGERLPPLELAEGDALRFELVLLGPANRHAPYYIYALMQLARRGIGRPGQRFRLEQVEALRGQQATPVYRGEDTVNLPPAEPLSALLARFRLPDGGRLRLRFPVPLRLDLNGHLVYPVEFVDLVRALVQRWRAFQVCYGPLGGNLDEEAARALVERARAVRRAADHTRWLDLSRYSTRQKARLKIGGAVGEVTYEFDGAWRPFAPLLAFGQLLHAGKLTSMGFGRLEVLAP